MPTNRDFRYIVCGLSYLLYSIFFLFSFNGENLDCIVKIFFKYNDLSAIVVLLFTTPIIGIIISTIWYWILVHCFGYGIYYYVPKDNASTDLVKHIIKRNPFLVDENNPDKLTTSDASAWGKEDERRFFPYFQAEVREKIGGEAMSFLERRWAVFWTHINIITGMISGLITALGWKVVELIEYSPSYTFNCEAYMIIGTLVSGFYVTAAIRQIISSRRDGMRFEHTLLLHEINTPDNRNNESAIEH